MGTEITAVSVVQQQGALFHRLVSLDLFLMATISHDRHHSAN